MQSQGALAFIRMVIKPFRIYIAGMMVIAVTWALILNVQAYIVKLVLNTAMGDGDQAFLHHKLAYLMGLYLFSEFVYLSIFRWYDWITIQLRPNIKKYIALNLMDRMMDHSHSFYQRQFAGSLSARVNDITIAIPDILRIVIDRLMACSLMLLFVLYNISQIHMKFTIALGLWIVLFLGISVILVFRNQHLAYDVADARAKVTGCIVDVLTNMASVRFFAAKKFEKGYLTRYMDVSVQKDQTRDWFFLKLHAFQACSFWIFQAVCFWWLLNGLVSKTMSPGDFVLVLTLNLHIIENFWNIAKDMRDFWEKMGNIVQGLTIIESPIEIEDSPHAKKLIVTKGEIVFDNVQFQYHDAESLFEHESVIIKSGQKVGLVGYSGSGKSTFVNLILRLFDVTEGRITIDGQDIRQVTQDSLHEAITMIPQDPSLFHRSLVENIAYGRRNATHHEIIAAAKRAYAHEFIVTLAQGYDTQVGERGIRLSGGQRQRIAIARAILKNAPILILDEATSQLDSVTESQIQDSLWDLMQGKTTLVIAHRLSTLLYMDRILVFDQGSIVEDGSHEELLAKGGLYKKLWEAQIGGFLLDNGEDAVHREH
ncbi:MAG TPA: ABC transporter ATP-binding protein [Candidatus Babeliales bacterium]|nr:ABC transporter ATP-binding protein [Candidatus Babeliales bacterium]HLC07329.1 ABC transporter ATP-binding protein [Candidatus Babeliales bacterium]